MSNWYYAHEGGSLGPFSMERLRALFDDGTVDRDTLVWNDERQGDWLALREFDDFKRTAAPPPLPAVAVADTWVWIMAFWPIVAGIVETIILESQGSESLGSGMITLYLIPYMAFISADRRVMERSGRSDRKVNFGWSLIVPVYLYKRALRLAKPKTTFWVWIAACLVSAFAPSALSSDYYMGIGLPKCTSGSTKTQVESLFPGIPLNLSDAEVLSIDNIKEVSVAATVRTCSASVSASDGNDYPITYTITEKGDNYLYYVRIGR